MVSTTPDTSLDELAEILAWRYQTLVQAGYPEEAATLLAAADEVDLHLACELLARGCPAQTAVRILA